MTAEPEEAVHADHDDVASAIHAMAGDEHEHAGWYEAWLGEHGERPPSLAPTERMLVPTATR